MPASPSILLVVVSASIVAALHGAPKTATDLCAKWVINPPNAEIEVEGKGADNQKPKPVNIVFACKRLKDSSEFEITNCNHKKDGMTALPQNFEAKPDSPQPAWQEVTQTDPPLQIICYKMQAPKLRVKQSGNIATQSRLNVYGDPRVHICCVFFIGSASLTARSHAAPKTGRELCTGAGNEGVMKGEDAAHAVVDVESSSRRKPNPATVKVYLLCKANDDYEITQCQYHFSGMTSTQTTQATSGKAPPTIPEDKWTDIGETKYQAVCYSKSSPRVRVKPRPT